MSFNQYFSQPLFCKVLTFHLLHKFAPVSNHKQPGCLPQSIVPFLLLHLPRRPCKKFGMFLFYETNVVALCRPINCWPYCEENNCCCPQQNSCSTLVLGPCPSAKFTFIASCAAHLITCFIRTKYLHSTYLVHLLWLCYCVVCQQHM